MNRPETEHMWSISDHLIETLDISNLSETEIRHRIAVIEQVRYLARFYGKHTKMILDYESSLRAALPPAKTWPARHPDWTTE